MSTVAELLVKIGADTSDIKKEINATKRMIRDAFGGDFLSMSQKAVVGLAGIGAAIAGIGVKAVQAAAKLQNVQTAFTNMLGSGEKSTAFVKELQQFAAKTPFEFSQVTEAAQKFLAFGFTAEQVIPTLTAVGDAAAGVGLGAEGINRVTLALGQMAAKSRVQSDEMLQLTEAGIPAWQMLADKIGKSVPEAMDMVSKGGVDAATGISALVEGMNSKFGGMMEQQSATIQGTWSTLMDGLEQSAAQVGLKISEAFNLPEIFQGIGDTLTNFATTVQTSGLTEAFRQAIPPEFQLALVAVATTLVGVAIPAIGLAISTLAGFAAPLIAAVSAAAPFIAGAAAIATALYAMWENGVTVTDVLDAIGIKVDLVNEVIETAKAFWEQLGNTLHSVLTVAQPIITAFAAAVVAMGKVVISVIGTLINWHLELLNTALQVFSTALSVVEWACNGIGDFLGWLGEQFMNIADAVLPEWASSGLKTIADFVGNAISWLDKLISKIFETNDALGKAGDAKKSQPTKKAKPERKAPTYEQFKINPAPGASTSKKGSSDKSETDKLLAAATNTSKQIADEWYKTFSTKTGLVDRWYKEELDTLDKSKSANVNYEVDKQRLAELYAKKRIDALKQEAVDKQNIINNARDMALEIKINAANLNNNAAEQEAEQMRLSYEKSINAINDKWKKQQLDFIAMTEQERQTYLKALDDYGVAYELQGKNQISFEKNINAEKLAAYKKYKDQETEYYTQCKDIQANIDKAYAQNSYSALKNALNSENMQRLTAYSEAQTIMKDYYDAATEAHMSFNERLANSITASKDSFQTFFTDLLTGASTFREGMLDLMDNLFNAIVSQITAGWAASITQGLLSSIMPGSGGSGGSGGATEGNPLAGLTDSAANATNAINGMTTGVGSATGAIGTGTSIMGSYNAVQSLITGTTKPAEGAATTTVTAALTALTAAATSAAAALAAMSAAGGLGFGFFAKGGLVMAAGGGAIHGAGTGTSDSIPAMLSNGEYVLSAKTTKRLGTPFLNAVNSGQLPGYATGGIVEPDYSAISVKRTNGGQSGATGDSSGGPSLTLNVATMDAITFDDFLSRGMLQRIKQALLDDNRNFNADFETF